MTVSAIHSKWKGAETVSYKTWTTWSTRNPHSPQSMALLDRAIRPKEKNMISK